MFLPVCCYFYLIKLANTLVASTFNSNGQCDIINIMATCNIHGQDTGHDLIHAI